METESTGKGQCTKCGKKLELKVCSSCWGKCTKGVWFWRRECQACSGKGQILRCPDEFLHFTSSFSSSRPSQVDLGAKQRATCLKCGGKAVFVQCSACRGERNWKETVPGQWSQEDLNKNPLLYYTSPPPITTEKVCPICKATSFICSGDFISGEVEISTKGIPNLSSL